MNILIFTNTFTPHVGGVARSVEAFADEYRKGGHGVLIVAPEFPGVHKDEVGVIRIPAIQNFNASDFSVVLPIHPHLSARIDDFQPDIVHSQHPFLLGMTAVRIARGHLPLVFTHHTLYEQYTHYVPGDSPVLKRFVIELATRYANLSDQVFAPSESIHDLLVQRGVTTPIAVVPTGVRLEHFAQGDGPAFRKQMGIPADAFVVGHLGRLAPEKNLEFLTRAVAEFVARQPQVHFLVVGSGPCENLIRGIFTDAEFEDRLHIAGVLNQPSLTNALHAMDVFAFASLSETQGMVLTEAMAAGLPVIALDAPGAREVVRDRQNGRLLQEECTSTFSAALQWSVELAPESLRDLKRAALKTAEAFSMPRSADKALACFTSLEAAPRAEKAIHENKWWEMMNAIKTEWSILKSLAEAGEAALDTRSYTDREE